MHLLILRVVCLILMKSPCLNSPVLNFLMKLEGFFCLTTDNKDKTNKCACLTAKKIIKGPDLRSIKGRIWPIGPQLNRAALNPALQMYTLSSTSWGSVFPSTCLWCTGAWRMLKESMSREKQWKTKQLSLLRPVVFYLSVFLFYFVSLQVCKSGWQIFPSLQI